MNENKDVNLDELLEYETGGAEYPTAEQSLFRMAVNEALTHEQIKIWEYYNYDKLTTTEIAKRMHTSQPNIFQRIRTIQKRLVKWVREHKEVYEALKEAENDNEAGC